MNDNDLIDELREGIRARTDHTKVPNGFIDQARRTARRRSARRAAAAGTPLLMAAGVATLIATSTGSGGSSPHRAQGPTVTVGGVQAHDTAYIVKRVQAKIAADSQSSLVIRSTIYASGDVSSDGSLVNLGKQTSSGYNYTAPDGGGYQRGMSGNIIGIGVTDPMVNGKRKSTLTVINRANHTYYIQASSLAGPSREGPSLNLASSSAAVQQALTSGRLTQMGTPTVNGTPAIALSVKLKQPSDATPAHLTLYVDAHTYQPLREVVTTDANEGPDVADWLPATLDNIAKAKDDTIPSGYTKVDPPTGSPGAGNTGAG